MQHGASGGYVVLEVATCSMVVLKWLMAAHCRVSTGNQDSTLVER